MNTVPHLSLVQFVEQAIQDWNADSIYTHHPSDTNNDHVMTSYAAQAASRLFQRKEGIKQLKQFIYMEVPSSTEWSFDSSANRFSPNMFVEVGKESVEIKLKALAAYSGVMRPYPHPLIYKQQIGRALSASKSKDPIIFDVVNNIENLYSIGAIEQEMRAAVSYYRFYGDGGAVVNERFHLIDEVRDARELFERLNDTLVASWDLMYDHARQYYEQYGNLDVPRRYKTAYGYSLGSWVQTQRKVYAGEQYGSLSEERVEKLNALGMRWGSYLDEAWERYYRAARKYYEAHGDLKVSVSETTDNGVALGNWLARLRTYRKSNIRNTYLTPERIAAMERIGMAWDVPDYLWEENFHAAMRYYREHGDLDMPADYKPDGIWVAKWLNEQRQIYIGKRKGKSLTGEQIKRLKAINMDWGNRNHQKWSDAWEASYRDTKAYYEAHGDLKVPNGYRGASGKKLAPWVLRQKQLRIGGKLSQERIAALRGIGLFAEDSRPDTSRMTTLPMGGKRLGLQIESRG